MEYPLSELLDRASILSLHVERCDGLAPLELLGEAKLFLESSRAYHDGRRLSWLSELKQLNGQIWDLESDIRRGKEGDLGLEEVGRRALAIRDINKKRIALKNEINAATGAFIERKTDHASAI